MGILSCLKRSSEKSLRPDGGHLVVLFLRLYILVGVLRAIDLHPARGQATAAKMVALDRGDVPICEVPIFGLPDGIQKRVLRAIAVYGGLKRATVRYWAGFALGFALDLGITARPCPYGGWDWRRGSELNRGNFTVPSLTHSVSRLNINLPLQGVKQLFRLNVQRYALPIHRLQTARQV